MSVYEQLAKAGAGVTYFCAYCGYEFESPPNLPVECPRCGRNLTNFGKPEVEPARPRVALRKRKAEEKMGLEVLREFADVEKLL